MMTPFPCTEYTVAEPHEGSGLAVPRGTPTPLCGEFVGGPPVLQLGPAGDTTRALTQLALLLCIKGSRDKAMKSNTAQSGNESDRFVHYCQLANMELVSHGHKHTGHSIDICKHIKGGIRN